MAVVESEREVPLHSHPCFVGQPHRMLLLDPHQARPAASRSRLRSRVGTFSKAVYQEILGNGKKLPIR